MRVCEEHDSRAATSHSMMEALEGRQLMAHPGITVMTQNVYYGGGGAGMIASGFTNLWRNVEQSKIPERAAAIAREIKSARPDLVALQEAVIWRTGSPLSSSRAKDVRFDFVKEIGRHLRKGAARYKVVSRVTNADWEVLGQAGSSLRDIRMTDQDVILARVGRGAKLRITASGHGTYRNQTDEISILGQKIDFTRGWASVDARIGKRGPKFRLINTHLEVFSPSVQEKQARELLAKPAEADMRVIIAGDFNSDANSGGVSYQVVRGKGFEDAWAKTHPGESGVTCCQPSNLGNSTSSLSSRVDLVMFDDNFKAVASDRVGEESNDRTPSGLWPSDHAGVVARLQFV